MKATDPIREAKRITDDIVVLVAIKLNYKTKIKPWNI